MTLERLKESTRLPEGNLEEIGGIMREKIEKVKEGEAREVVLVEGIQEEEEFSCVSFGEEEGRVRVATEPLNQLIMELLKEEGGREDGCSHEYLGKDDKGRPLERATYFTGESNRKPDFFFTRETSQTKKVVGRPLSSTWKVWREKGPLTKRIKGKLGRKL